MEKKLAALLRREYGIHPVQLRPMGAGAGSEAWHVMAGEGAFLFKCPAENGMNHPENEPALCAFLRRQGIPASVFLPTCGGEALCRWEGCICHLQRFEAGQVYAYHQAPAWLLAVSREMLGRIHTALEEYPALPVGIGPSYFAHMTQARALDACRRTIARAEGAGFSEMAAELRLRIRLLEKGPLPLPDIAARSCKNTHGDFCVSQLICADGEIHAVVDWTSACVHPAVWEVMRSFVLGAASAATGSIDPQALMAYLDAYRRAAPLPPAEILAMPALFYAQIAVCDYHGQALDADGHGREIFRQQAALTTRLMAYFDRYLSVLTDMLAARYAAADG